jgi:uncharacterized membrane protein
MTALIVGLLLFLGLHSIRFIADGARSRFIEQRGLKTWRALYSVVSGIGFVLIIWGYSLTLRQPVVLYEPAPWTRALAGVLTLAAIVLITASFVPRNHFRAWVGHPLVLGTALWALAHLQATRTLAGLLLFGGFLAWALVCFTSLRARDKAAGVQRKSGGMLQSVIALVVGVAAWAGFTYSLHARLIGVAPFG